MTAWPPTMNVMTPTTPITTAETPLIADTPVIDFATFRRSRCTPSANTRSSRFSAV